MLSIFSGCDGTTNGAEKFAENILTSLKDNDFDYFKFNILPSKAFILNTDAKGDRCNNSKQIRLIHHTSYKTFEKLKFKKIDEIPIDWKDIILVSSTIGRSWSFCNEELAEINIRTEYKGKFCESTGIEVIKDLNGEWRLIERSALNICGNNNSKLDLPKFYPIYKDLRYDSIDKPYKFRKLNREKILEVNRLHKEFDLIRDSVVKGRIEGNSVEWALGYPLNKFLASAQKTDNLVIEILHLKTFNNDTLEGILSKNSSKKIIYSFEKEILILEKHLKLYPDAFSIDLRLQLNDLLKPHQENVLKIKPFLKTFESANRLAEYLLDRQIMNYQIVALLSEEYLMNI